VDVVAIDIEPSDALPPLLAPIGGAQSRASESLTTGDVLPANPYRLPISPPCCMCRIAAAGHFEKHTRSTEPCGQHRVDGVAQPLLGTLLTLLRHQTFGGTYASILRHAGMLGAGARGPLDALQPEPDLHGSANLFHHSKIPKRFAANGCRTNGAVWADHRSDKMHVLAATVMTDQDPGR